MCYTATVYWCNMYISVKHEGGYSIMENMKDIKLAELFSALLRKLWFVVLCAVIVGALSYAYTANFITPLYRSSITIYVNNRNATTNNILKLSSP